MPQQLNELREKVKSTGKKLFTMTKEERISLFEGKTINKELSNFIEEKFDKALQSKRKGAIHKWLEDFTVGKKVIPTDTISKIQKALEKEISKGNLDENSILDKAVKESLGISISEENVKIINQLTKELSSIPKTDGNQMPNIDYLKKRTEIEEYITSETKEDPFLKQFFSIYSRAIKLTGSSTQVLNLASNSVVAITENIVDIIYKKGELGSNKDLIMPYVKQALKIYNATGFDISRADTIFEDPLVWGEKRTKASYKGFKIVENIVFKYLMGTPDVAFSSLNFAMTLDRNTTAQARTEGLTGEALKNRARELFQKATNITDVQSPDVDLMRQGAKFAAEYATGQMRNRIVTNLALEIRQVLDNISPSLQIGTNLDPFVKTAIGFGMISYDYSPFAALTSLTQMISGKKPTNQTEIEFIEKQFVRAGLGTLLAIILTSLLEREDYIPDYSQSTPFQRQQVLMGNGVHYGIKIGNKWISLQFLPTVGLTASAIMQGRQAMEDSKADTELGQQLDKLFGTGKAVWTPFAQFPVVSTFLGLADTLDPAQDYGTGDSKVQNIQEGIADFTAGSLIPNLLSQIGGYMDQYDRKTFYDNPIDNFQKKIPIVREELPIRYDMFGEPIKSKGLAGLLFGSRGAKVMNDPVLNEIVELNKQNNLDTTDITISASSLKPVAEAKKKLNSREYDLYLAEIQKETKLNMQKVITSEKYQTSTGENKEILLENARYDAVKIATQKLGYDFTNGWKPNKQTLKK